MAIYVMHGVAENRSPELFAHRNLLDRQMFIAHLADRKEPYSTIESALQDSSDALTIDDATEAAAEAALLARGAGHAVHLFVNPEVIEAALPYSFVRLNAMLDATRVGVVAVWNQEFDLMTFRGRKRFRKVAKDRLRRSDTQGDDDALLAEIQEHLGVSAVSIPPHMQTITPQRLQQLVKAGVIIENHGWSHRDCDALTWPDLVAGIERAGAWIQRRCTARPRYFAVPFGECPPREIVASCEQWLLCTDHLYIGGVGSQLVNRAILKLSTPD